MKTLGKMQKLAIASLSAIALFAAMAVAQTQTTQTGQTTEGSQKARGEWHGRGGKGRHGKRMGGRGWGGMHGAFSKQLNLTDDQKAKMKAIRESFAERNKPLRDELRAKRQELRQASEGGTFNEALAAQKLTEMAGLQAKLMGQSFSLRQEMMTVLTSEQKTQLEQQKAQFKAKRAEGQHGRRSQ
jgi:Spy/CpxP family protein refolding chaperone